MDSTENQLTKICVNLYSGDYEFLKEIALKQDRDVSWIVRNIVRNHVRNLNSDNSVFAGGRNDIEFNFSAYKSGKL